MGSSDLIARAYYRDGYEDAKEEIKRIIKKRFIDINKLRNPEEEFTLTKKQAVKDLNGELGDILKLIDKVGKK